MKIMSAVVSGALQVAAAGLDRGEALSPAALFASHMHVEVREVLAGDGTRDRGPTGSSPTSAIDRGLELGAWMRPGSRRRSCGRSQRLSFFSTPAARKRSSSHFGRRFLPAWMSAMRGALVGDLLRRKLQQRSGLLALRPPPRRRHRPRRGRRGCTAMPPQEIGQLMRPRDEFRRAIRVPRPPRRRESPSRRSSSLSRIAASITTPPRPSFLQALIMIEPMSAQVRSPLPSITRMSPGFAIEIAAWIMRLSPARTSIVNAGPARRIAGETRRDAGIERSAAPGHVGEDGRGERSRLAHDFGRDALEIAADVGQRCRGREARSP